jgi:ribA/ribD-fused uncharacterized protein
METENEIYFYKLHNAYSYLSNFYPTQFIDENGLQFNCSEQYFMYHKCKTFDPTNDKLLQTILAEQSPDIIKKYGRRISNYSDAIWSQKRYGVMLSGLRLKFNQNEAIRKSLIDTKNKTLYEASKYDRIWGIGYYANDAIHTDWSKYGTNLLGKALMELRAEL